MTLAAIIIDILTRTTVHSLDQLTSEVEYHYGYTGKSRGKELQLG